MNRSILIVICDFVVSAMLSFYTGSAPMDNSAGAQGAALDGRTAALVLSELRNEQARLEAARQALLEAKFKEGFSADLEAQLKSLTERLAEANAKSEILEKKLALTPESSGALSPEQLQKQLESEIRSRMQMNLKHQESLRELESIRQQNKETAARNIALHEETAARRAELEQTRKTVAEREKELEQTREAAARHRENLAKTQSELKTRTAEFQKLDKQTRADLTKRKEVEGALAFTQGKLSATERELAEAQSNVERDRKALTTRELELTEANRKLANMQTALKNAVGELSKTQAQLKETKAVADKLPETEKQAEIAAAELKAAREKLDIAEEKLRSDVLERYAGAVAKLQSVIREKRMLIPYAYEQELFLPLVELNGKTCVVGDFLMLTGNIRDRNRFDGVTELAYTASAPDGGAAAALPGPLYAPVDEPRVGLIEAKADGRKPLSVMPLSALKKRGLQDLYLFKANAFGKESTSLEGRCSLNFASGDEHLYIRNLARGVGSELRAEPGDFVLTKQGEFVGVIVANETFDLGRRQEARCVVFPDRFDWSRVHTMPTAKNAGAEYLTSFIDAARPVLAEIRKREVERQSSN